MILIPAGVALGMLFAPTETPVIVKAVSSGLVVAALVANALMLPPWAKTAIADASQALAAAGQPQAMPRIIAKAKSLKPPPMAVFVVASIALFVAAIGTLTACPLPADAPNVISSAAACAIDVFEDVTRPPTPELVQKTLADCGITAADAYADIQQLLANAKRVDAGDTVTTKRGAHVARAAYVSNLDAWAALLSDGGAK